MSRGFFAKLTPEQQQAALEYRGPENIGGQTITHTFTDEELDRVLDRVVAWLLGGCCPDATEAADALAFLRAGGWLPIETAPKDKTPILAIFRSDLGQLRPDLESWQGKQAVLHHVGLADDGYDIGWSMNAPVGHGGFPDEWIAGYRPLPPAPESKT